MKQTNASTMSFIGIDLSKHEKYRYNKKYLKSLCDKAKNNWGNKYTAEQAINIMKGLNK